MSSSAITGPVLSDTRRAPSGTAAAPSFAFNDSTGTGVYLVSAGVLGLSTAGVQRVVVDASGNVGIGTASPETKLHISYGLATGDYISTGGTNRNQNGLNKIVKFKHGYWSGTQEVASIGVVTTSSTSGNGYGFGDLVFYTGSSGNGDIGSTSTERMRIDSSGNLLVGTAAVGGKVSISNGGSGAVGLRVDTSNTGPSFILTGNVSNLQVQHPADGLELYNSAGTAIRVVAATAGVRLAANGNSWGAISDERKKKNIKPLEYGLEQVRTLKPIRYDYKLDESEESARLGFIAQDLLPVVKEAVYGTEDTEYSISPTDLIPVMVKAMQEQQEIIGKLEARLAALESK